MTTRREPSRASGSPSRWAGLLLIGLLGMTAATTRPGSTLGALPVLRAQQTSEEQVRAVFYRYKEALVSGDGVTAAALVDRETLDYFEEVRELALSGSAEQIRQRSFIDRLLIVSMRHEIAPEAMSEIELEDLIRTAMSAGWISPASIQQLEIRDIRVDGNSATGSAVTSASLSDPTLAGPVDDLRYGFALEGGQWKFRFSSLVDSLNGLIAQFTRQLGTDEDDLIFTLVEAFSGRAVLPEVWDKPP